MKITTIIMSAIFLVFGLNVYAAEFPAQGRLFLGSSQASLGQVNENLKADGMSAFASVGQYGLEITYPVKSFLNVGIRYHKTDQVAYENPETSLTNYEAELIQDDVLLLARSAIYKQGLVLVDLFVGVGGTNTTYKVRTATQSGELTKSAPGDWFASPTAAAGVSVGVGYNNIYGFVEVGYEFNKVSSFQRTGSVNASIKEIDFSGGYATVGILFDGIKATSK